MATGPLPSDAVSYVVLRQVQKYLSVAFPEAYLKSMSLELQTDYMARNIVANLGGAYAKGSRQKNESRTARVPKTWWDMFKIAYFPVWLLKRYPPTLYSIYSVVEHHEHRYCPHLITDPDATHINWIRFGIEEDLTSE